MGLFQSVRPVNKKKRSVRSKKHARLRVSPACRSLPVPSSLLQGSPQIPAEKSKVTNFNGWLCRARDVQTKRVISISQAVSPSQRLKSSCDGDTTEIVMGKDHTQSQGDAGAAALCSGYTGETECSPLTELSLKYPLFLHKDSGVQWQGVQQCSAGRGGGSYGVGACSAVGSRGMHLGHISSTSWADDQRNERDIRCHGTEAVYCHCDTSQGSKGVTNTVSHWDSAGVSPWTLRDAPVWS